MIISGLQTRRIASQNEFSFDLTASLSNVIGKFDVGFSGVSGNKKFTFESGRIQDIENRFVWGYRSGENIRISGNFTDRFYNYWINNTPICLGNKETGYYDYFYMNGQNVSAIASLEIKADAPTYSFVHVNSLYSGNSLRIDMYNTESLPIRKFSVFSGDIQANTGYFSLSGFENPAHILSGNSGVFTFYLNPKEGNFLTQFAVPMNIYTDFGVINPEFDFQYLQLPFYFFDFFTGYTGSGFNASGDPVMTFQYELDIINQSGYKPLYVQLKNYAGNNVDVSGEFSLTGNLSGFVSGYIVNVGITSGYLSGTGYSTGTNWFGNLVNGTIFSDNFSINQYATGSFNIINPFLVSGLLTGGSPLGYKIPATGTLSGLFGGFIIESGLISGLTTGIVSGYYYSSLNTGLFSGSGSILQYATGNFSSSYSMTGYGNILFSGFSGGFRSFTFLDTISGITGFSIVGNTGSILLSGSSGIRDTVVNKYFIITPQMTSNNTPFGTVSGSSNLDVTILGYQAFDRDFNSNIGLIGNTGFLDYSFGSGGGNVITTCKKYGIFCNGNAWPYYPTSFAISGSNDGVNWIGIDSRTGQTFIPNQFKFYYPSTTGTFDILRFCVFNNTGGFQSSITEIFYLNYNSGQFLSSIDTVPKMTSNSTPIGQVFRDNFDPSIFIPNIVYTGVFDNFSNIYRIFDKEYGTNHNFQFNGVDGLVLPSIPDTSTFCGLIYKNANLLTGIGSRNFLNFNLGGGITGDSQYSYMYCPRGYIASEILRINSKTTSNVFSFPDMVDFVNHVAIKSGIAYIGGNFTSYSGRNNILALSGNVLIPYNMTAVNQHVHAVYPFSQGILLGTLIGNNDLPTYSGFAGLLKTDYNGILDPTFNASICQIENTGAIFSILSYNNDSQFFVGGRFNSINTVTGVNYSYTGISGTRTIIFDKDRDSARKYANLSVIGRVYCIDHDSGNNYYFGGDFGSVSGDGNWNRIAKYDSNLNIITSFRFNVNGTIRDIKISGSTLFAAGDFNTVNGIGRTGLFSVSLTGTGDLTSFAPKIDGSVYSIDFNSSGHLFIGGSFNQVNDTTRNKLAVLDGLGNLFSVAANIDNTVRCVKNINSLIYFGGDFTTVNGQSFQYGARIDINNGFDVGWNPSFDSTVKCMATGSGNLLFYGGNFSSVSGNNKYRYSICFNQNGTISNGFSPFAVVNTNKIVADNSGVYAICSDNQSFFNDNCYAIKSDYNGNPLPWAIASQNNYETIHFNNQTNQIVLGGDFQSQVGSYRNCIAKLDVSGIVLPWNPYILNNGGSFTLNAVAACYRIATGYSGILAAGTFSNVGLLSGNAPINSLTTYQRTGIFNANDSNNGNLIPNFNAKFDGPIFALAPDGSGNIWLGGGSRTTIASCLTRINSNNGVELLYRKENFVSTSYQGVLALGFDDITNSGTYFVGSDTSLDFYKRVEPCYFYGSGSGIAPTYYTIVFDSSQDRNMIFPYWELYGYNKGESWEFIDYQYADTSTIQNYSGDFTIKNTTGKRYDIVKFSFEIPSGQTNSLVGGIINEIYIYNSQTGQITDYSGTFTKQFTGSGQYQQLFSGISTGYISNPTGLQPAFGYINQGLSGTIVGNSGTFAFTNLIITGIPIPSYLYPIGEILATGWFYFISGDNSFDPSSSDNLQIGNQTYYYSNFFTTKPFYFSGIQDLSNTINSGVTGGYGNTYTGVGINSIVSGNYLLLTSVDSGTYGNGRILNYSSNLGLISSSGPYTTGGQFFYQTGAYSVPMTGNYPTYIYVNSGVYLNYVTGAGTGAVTGLVFRDSFTGTWTGYSGILNDLSGLNYNTGLYAFTGVSIIGSGENALQINFEFIKNMPYNQLTGTAIYLVSGQGFVYSGVIGV